MHVCKDQGNIPVVNAVFIILERCEKNSLQIFKINIGKLLGAYRFCSSQEII